MSAALAAVLATLGVVMVAAPASADGKRDFNGDGRGDLLALFDYGNGDTGLWVFPGAPNRPDGQPGQIGAYEAWETGPGNYWISATKNVAGDFNGDGRTDIMSLYDYGNGAAGLFVIPGTGGSGPSATDAYRVWYTPPGNFWLSDVKLAAGDVNGDGKDDLIAVYHYPDDTMGVWVFPGTASVGDGSSEPYESWQSPSHWYPLSQVEFTAGDINGDGRDDLVGLWDYPNTTAILWVWASSPSGPGNPYQIYYNQNWEPNVGQRAQLTTFNQNNDGMDDIAVVSNAEIRIFNGTAQQQTGYSTPYVLPLELPTDSAVLTRSVITSADIDGDGEGEIIGMFDNFNGGTSMWVLSGSPDAVFEWYLAQVWSAIPGDFPMNRTKVAR
ncbi:FG-GAP repeat domain-containing protein [Rugosimonospora africana]|nr:VCBS repeat-containing protein [Rugosimonospora africana]